MAIHTGDWVHDIQYQQRHICSAIPYVHALVPVYMNTYAVVLPTHTRKVPVSRRLIKTQSCILRRHLSATLFHVLQEYHWYRD